MLRFEERFGRSEKSRSFDEDFFDFSDPLRPWTTVYRFMLLFDWKNAIQAMVGFGQKRSGRHRVNGVEAEFEQDTSQFRVPLSYWCYNKELAHNTEHVILEAGDRGSIESEGFSFSRDGDGYHLRVQGLGTRIFMEGADRSDYMHFNIGYVPFSRHNCYLPYEGEIMGHKSEGVAFVQKVNHNMPFIPWRWGRAFFEDGSNLVFFEPRPGVRLFKNLSLVHEGKKYEFKKDTRLEMEKNDDGLPRWRLSGRTKKGESIHIEGEALARVENRFDSKRSSFSYNEFPTRILDLEFRGPDGVVTADDLGRSSFNTEDAYYVKLI
jgi:hypothetical protein